MLPTKFRWWPCLLTDRDKMSSLHRGHSIDDSYQVLVVAMLVNRLVLIFSSENPLPNELKLGRKHLWKVLSKKCTFCYDPLPRRRTPSDGKSSYCLWQGLLKRILKCEYLLVMYRINMLHYISINF
jgi:hypothetical protein